VTTELVSKVLQGNVRAAAKLIRGIEDAVPDALKSFETIYAHTGKAHIIGITGAPGVGKSTLVDTVIADLRQRDITVGVIAIDPSSPFTGGAILGDRVRMSRHTGDSGVFIRSLATRGYVGGLSKATISTIHVMDAMNKDIIIVETVGVGQAEIDVTRVADTSVLTMMPGMGDSIQTMKAGILEAVDIFVVNKADQDGAHRLNAELNSMLAMKNYLSGDWQPPVLLTEAINSVGTRALVTEILKHRDFIAAGGELDKRRRARARLALMEAIQDATSNYIDSEIDSSYLENIIDDLTQRKLTPYAAAGIVIGRVIRQVTASADGK